MKTVRLARYYELKYSLVSEAVSDEDKRINLVRQELVDAYNHYINIDSRQLKPAYNIVPLLAESGEKYSKQLISLMENLVRDIDTKDLYEIFDKVQAILAFITELQGAKRSEVRNSIHDMIPIRRDTDKNRREQAKSKFENVVFKKLASLLEKQAKSLNVMLGKSAPIAGGPTEPEVKEPTKEEQNMFRRTQLAVAHHLDHGPIFGQIWGYPDLKRRLIRLINKGKNRWLEVSTDPEIAAETAAIVEEFKRRQTNESYFDSNDPQKHNFISPELKKEREEQQRLLEEAKQEEWEKLQEVIRLRDEGWQRRQLEEQQEQLRQQELEEDRQRHLRSDGSSRLTKIMKRYQ